MASDKEKSKILIIGGTGYIGKFLVRAAARSGHPTFALVRDVTAASSKAHLLEEFKSSGVTLIQGDVYDHESLVRAMKEVDVVISAFKGELGDQIKIIDSIKEAGNIKRFFPSEFGNDVDRVHAVEPAKTMYAKKAKIRRTIEASGIPYTFVSCNFFADYFLRTLGQAGTEGFPTDIVTILSDGNAKGHSQRLMKLGGDHNTAVTRYRLSLYASDAQVALCKVLLLPPLRTLIVQQIAVAMAEEKSKILIIGATGSIGKYVVEASVRLGHPTFALVRETTPSHPAKAKIIEGFKNLGVTLVNGDLKDNDSLVKAMNQVDVVISTVGAAQVADQTNIIAAIKEVGHIKRFLPSEFGNVAEVTNTVPPLSDIILDKVKIRRAIEAEGIPYTYISSNFASSYFLPTIGQTGAKGIPQDKVVILGDGNAKVIFVADEDIGTYTVKAADDSRTLNKILYMRPSEDIYSHNELVSLWEKKSGKKLERIYVPEEEVLKQIKELERPHNVLLSISHSVFVRGDHTNFEIDPSTGVEASELYPEVKYITVSEYLNRFL